VADVLLYTSNFCGYCIAAKRLLERRGVAFEEVNLHHEPARRSEMLERSEGRYTVPQIFIDGRGIGGYDQLSQLEATGELDRLLAAGDD